MNTMKVKVSVCAGVLAVAALLAFQSNALAGGKVSAGPVTLTQIEKALSSLETKLDTMDARLADETDILYKLKALADDHYEPALIRGELEESKIRVAKMDKDLKSFGETAKSIEIMIDALADFAVETGNATLLEGIKKASDDLQTLQLRINKFRSDFVKLSELIASIEKSLNRKAVAA